MSQLATLSGYAVQRRSRLRRWVRVVAALTVLAAIAYAALPWWLPTGWIANQLTAQMSRDFGREVSIRHMQVGWTGGVELHEVVIAGAAGQPDEPLARVGVVRCGFTPLATWWTGQVDRVELESAELWVTVDETGKLNLLDLKPQKQGQLPTMHYELRNTVLHIVTPESKQNFRVDRLACELERQTGKLLLSGGTTVNRGEARGALPPVARLKVEAELTVPTLKPDEQLNGEVSLNWTDLTLDDLPVALVSQLPIAQVAGVTTGEFKFTARPDLGIDHELSIAFHGVRIARTGHAETAGVPDAAVALAGHWDPAAEELILHRVSWDTPGVLIRGSTEAGEPPVLIDANAEKPLSLRLTGQVRSWEQLARELPDLRKMLDRAGVTLRGESDFAVAFQRTLAGDTLVLKFDATRSSLRAGDGDGTRFAAPTGMAKRLTIDADYHRRERAVTARTLRMELGAGGFDLTGHLPLPDEHEPIGRNWLVRAMPALSADLRISVGRGEELLTAWPALAESLPNTAWTGPLSAALSIAPNEDAADVRLTLEAPPQAEGRIEDWLHKPAGAPLAARFAVMAPHELRGTFTGLAAEMTCGDAGVRVGGDDGRVTCSFNESGGSREFIVDGPAGSRSPGADESDLLDGLRELLAAWLPADAGDVELRADLPLQITAIEQALELSPSLKRAMLPEGSQRTLEGNLDADVSAGLSIGDAGLLSFAGLRLRTTDAGIVWDDLIDKPRGLTCAMTLDVRWQRVADRQERSASMRLDHAAGSIVVGATVQQPLADAASGAPAAKPWERIDIDADIHDLQALPTLCPALDEALRDLHLSGAIRADIESVVSPEGDRVSLTLDAGEASFTLPGGEPLTKPVGIPAKVAMILTRPDQAGSDWRFESDDTAFGGFQVASLNGTCTGLPGPPVAGWLAALSDPPAIDPAAIGGRLAATVRADFSERLTDWHPQLARLRRQFGLGGTADLDVSLDIASGEIDARGAIAAKDTAWRIETGVPAAPHFHKEAGSPGETAFNIGYRLPTEGKTAKLDIRELLCASGSNELRVTGELAMSAPPAAAQLDSGRLWVGVRLADAGAARSLVPGAAVGPASGGLDADAELTFTGGRMRVERGSATCRDLQLDLYGSPLGVSGGIALDRERIDLDQLVLGFGSSHGVLSGNLALPEPGGKGRLGVVFDRLDMVDLTRRIKDIAVKAGPPSAAGSAPASAPAGSEATAAASDGNDVLAMLRRQDFIVEGHIRTLVATLPMEVGVTADAVGFQLDGDDGALKATFHCVIDGGIVDGSVDTDLNVADPVMHLQYTADAIGSGELVDSYLRLTFPGMTATGTLTLIDESYQKLLPEPGNPNYPVGKGELMIGGGTIVGRAAPLWLTRIFPGLNLSSFEFSYMHQWFEKLPSGRVRHRMIYQGKYYNIYTDGYTEPDKTFRYDVGVDFLADFDSKYWAEVGQGRIPMFTKTGKLTAEGRIVDEQVTYQPPERILETLLISNNPVITAYHAIRKRVRGEE